MKNTRKLLAWVLLLSMILSCVPSLANVARAETAGDTAVINAMDYGADPTGAVDSAEAIWNALKAAKELEAEGKTVTLEFPRGEYHIYKDKAQKREYHTSNTNSIENPVKTVGFLVEEHKNLTIDGNGSLFMMHGNMMAFAVVKSENITLKDFSWDFAVPTVTELTVTDSGTNYTEFYIPECFPYTISGNTLVWSSDLSPYTGEPYWTATGNHNTYAIIAYHPDDEMARNFGTDISPFTGATGITDVGNNVIRITYSSKNATQCDHHKVGTVFALCGNAHRETAGAFTWESKNVLAEGVNVHFMHGFGWLIQMSEDVTYRNCNLMPRENSGHMTVSFADGLHASGAKGEIVIENCNFSNTHDDPINFHGTFTRVEQRIDDHTLKLKYIHNQQGGFPQFHVGDEVAFFTRDTLESSDNETLYTVSEVVSDPGESGNDLRTMVVRFEQTLPAFLTQTVSNGSPKYVAENVTYAPAVTIKNSTFKNVPTRGILCTTRQPVLIEGNTFLNMSMATIFLSNDSNDWYESGPIRDMTIRNNHFFIKTIGDTYWDYKSAIYIHPVTYGGGLPSSDNPIHKNITIEGNTFNMSDDTVVKAESVENLIIRNNTILRTDPEFAITLSAGSTDLSVGETAALATAAEGTTIIGDNNKNLSDTTSRSYDNVFEFTACKNVVIEGNTYDDGMKNYAVISNMPESNLTNKDDEISVVTSAGKPASAPVSDLVYVSSDPNVLSVNADGQMTAKAAGTADVYAYYAWNGTVVKSNKITVTVAGTGAAETAVQIRQEGTVVLNDAATSARLTANTDVTWAAVDFLTGEATDAVAVAQDGTVTAVKNGIAWVKATAGTAEDRIPVVVSMAKAPGLSPDFSIIREDSANYSMTENTLTITQQGGSDLWTYDNTLKNLFLYDDFDRTDLRTVVKVSGLPIRANNNWDTASFLLYAGDDDYVSIGKKGHMDGFSTVVEQAQACNEYQESTATNNSVTTAYVGFTVANGNISMDYKLEGGAWTTVKTNSAALLGSSYKIGFGAWGTGGNDVTFSEFKVGKASEVTYAQLEAADAITIGAVVNAAPTASAVTFGAASYNVGEKATVTFTYNDADGDARGTSLYLWTYEENGTEKTAVTDVPEFLVVAPGGLTCTVFPVDAVGTPGAPAQETVTTKTGDANLALRSLSVNGVELLAGEGTAYEVSIPADLAKVELSYQSLMAAEGTTTVKVGTQGAVTKGNTACFGLDVTAGKIITVTRSAEGQADQIYTVTLIPVESNATDIQGIAIPELNFSVTDLSTGYWLTGSTAASATLKVLADDTIGNVEVRYNNYRKPIAMTKTESGYEANVNFITGLNSYYVTVVAKDGITYEQYNVNVVYTPNTASTLQGLKINGESLGGFASNTHDYLVELNETDTLKVEAITEQQVRIRIGDEYIMENEGKNTLEVTDLEGGSYDIYVVTVADDGIVKNAYHIDAVVPYVENVELFAFHVNGKNILDEFDEAGNAKVFVPSDTAQVEVVTKDTGASLKAVIGEERSEAVASLSKTVTLGDGTATVAVTVTARDGVTTKTYTVELEKVLDPNDASRDIPVSVLTATAGDWQTGYEATEGPANLVLDNDITTLWHTDWYGTSRANHWIQFELSEDYAVDGLRYKPREGGSNGTILEYEIQISDDGKNFETVATGTWENNTNWKAANFEDVTAKYVRLVAVNAVTDNAYVFASAAEIRLTGERVTIPEETTPEETTPEETTPEETTPEDTKPEETKPEETKPEATKPEETKPQVPECDKDDNCVLSQFADIKVDDWYHDGIHFCVENKIMNGMGEGVFAPNEPTTRAQLVTMLYRLEGEPTIEGKTEPFSDVAETDWFYAPIVWAYNNKVVNGVSDTEFAPNANVTREQVATILYRFLGSPEGEGKLDEFPDVAKVSDYAKDALVWAVGAKLITGVAQPDGTTLLDPAGNATRAQIATILMRHLTA